MQALIQIQTMDHHQILTSPFQPLHRNTVTKKHLPEAKEAQVTARKAEDKGGPQTFGSLSTVRREILSIVRAEDEEHWQDFEFCGLETEESATSMDAIFSQSGEVLQCQSDITAYLKDIQGL